MVVPKLRIAHFGRYGEGDTDIVRSMFLSLKQMGHTVQEWNMDLYDNLVYNPHKRNGGYGPIYIRLKPILQRLLEFKPDLIICNAGGFTFKKSAISLLQAQGIPVLGITLSDPDVMDTAANYIDRFTWHTTNSMESFKKYKSLGYSNTYYMPFGIDRRFFEERAPSHKYQTDVAVIGHGRPDRYPIAEKLCQNFHTKLYGKGWPYPKQSLGPVRGEEWFQAAYSAKLLINFPRTIKGYSNVKVGIFEGTATGRLVFTKYFKEMEYCFEYGKEIIGYKSEQDLIDKIRYYLANPEKANAIAQAGRLRCLTEHTWEKRFEFLFNKLGLTKN
jgi:spore maturation protein CgeB